MEVREGTVVMSKILLWYGKDFGSNEEEVMRQVLAFLRFVRLFEIC